VVIHHDDPVLEVNFPLDSLLTPSNNQAGNARIGEDVSPSLASTTLVDPAAPAVQSGVDEDRKKDEENKHPNDENENLPNTSLAATNENCEIPITNAPPNDSSASVPESITVHITDSSNVPPALSTSRRKKLKRTTNHLRRYLYRQLPE